MTRKEAINQFDKLQKIYFLLLNQQEATDDAAIKKMLDNTIIVIKSELNHTMRYFAE